MYTLIAILIIIASILLTLVVLVQNSKGGGLAANFASGNQTFGVRQTADFLEKTTWTLAIVILVLCIAATAFISTGSEKSESAIQQRLEQTATQATPDFSLLPNGEATTPEPTGEQN
ncbi:MAG: preprotein translocase subunit SecG [Bacteroidales bacterium]|jgi:preprotein translocase subunit SecG|nr:preprotein translocase subunit SecG [Bacteroidales bacterium]